MRVATSLLALGLVLLTSHARAADLASCVPLQDDAARLACYDRAAGRSSAAPNTAAPAAAAQAPAAVAAPALPPAETAKPPRFIHSRIVGPFTGWRRGTRFTLANGQTWEAIGPGTQDGSSESPEVTIERTLIGQTLMTVQGMKARAIVREVQP
jgi:hypothetical protein